MNGKYEYPFLECSRHPGPQRCYIVCCHVRKGGAEPDLINLASDKESGDILCSECADILAVDSSGKLKHNDRVHSEEFLSKLAPVCEGCVINFGWLLGVSQ